MSITITEADFMKIAGCIGYPAIPIEVLEYTAEQIKDIFIHEAMEYYFSRFPVKETFSGIYQADFEIPFPDEKTFGIVDARVNRKNYGATEKSGSAFQNSLLYSRSTGASSRYIGINSFHGLPASEIGERLTNQINQQSIIDQNGAQRIKVDVQDRTVKGFVNTQGELTITWAKTSEDFGDVPFKDKEYLIWYAQSIILKRFALLRDQANSNQGVDFNTGPMHTEADKQERKALEKWGKRRAVVVLRG